MTHLESFEKFHVENPHVYELFKKFAKQALDAGRQTLSGSLIMERIRWETVIQTTGDQFKLNNNHCAFYARKFHEDHPQFGEVFVTRQQRKEYA